MNATRDRLEALQAELRALEQADLVAELATKRAEALAELAGTEQACAMLERRLDTLEVDRAATLDRLAAAEHQNWQHANPRNGTRWSNTVLVGGALVAGVTWFTSELIGVPAGSWLGLVPASLATAVALRSAWRRR